MAGIPNAPGAVPFAGAALPYREQFYSTTWSPTTTTQAISPPGNAIKSYGYARALRVYTTSASGSGGNLAADAPWNAYANVQVQQPNGEELFGGPTFTGYHSYLAAKYSGWKLNNDPATLSSYVSTASSPVMDLTIPFEINPQYGLGSLPNQDFSAPWKLTLVGNTTANIWTTAPTTNPTFTTSVFLDAWTVPSSVNPLSGQPQQQQPFYLGTLSKWTLQSYTVPSSTAFEVPFSRRGNAYRRLVFITRNSSGARVASQFPNPISLRWDGTVIRTNDNPALWTDDDYMVQGGQAGSTPTTNQTGVISLGMAAIAGIDTQGAANSFGEEPFWGTVQSSTISLSGTWGSTISTLEQITNDVQLVDLTGNPYQFNQGMYLQAPAQASARP